MEEFKMIKINNSRVDALIEECEAKVEDVYIALVHTPTNVPSNYKTVSTFNRYINSIIVDRPQELIDFITGEGEVDEDKLSKLTDLRGKKHELTFIESIIRNTMDIGEHVNVRKIIKKVRKELGDVVDNSGIVYNSYIHLLISGVMAVAKSDGVGVDIPKTMEVIREFVPNNIAFDTIEQLVNHEEEIRNSIREDIINAGEYEKDRVVQFVSENMNNWDPDKEEKEEPTPKEEKKPKEPTQKIITVTEEDKKRFEKVSLKAYITEMTGGHRKDVRDITKMAINEIDIEHIVNRVMAEKHIIPFKIAEELFQSYESYVDRAVDSGEYFSPLFSRSLQAYIVDSLVNLPDALYYREVM